MPSLLYNTTRRDVCIATFRTRALKPPSGPLTVKGFWIKTSLEGKTVGNSSSWPGCARLLDVLGLLFGLDPNKPQPRTLKPIYAQSTLCFRNKGKYCSPLNHLHDLRPEAFASSKRNKRTLRSNRLPLETAHEHKQKRYQKHSSSGGETERSYRLLTL